MDGVKVQMRALLSRRIHHLGIRVPVQAIAGEDSHGLGGVVAGPGLRTKSSRVLINQESTHFRAFREKRRPKSACYATRIGFAISNPSLLSQK